MEIEYGANQYRRQPNDMSSIINRLLKFYQLEGLHVAYTMADFRRDYIIDELPNLLQDKSIRKELVGEIVAVMLNQLSVDEIQTYLHQEESPSEDQKRLIKAIGRTLMLRFQVEGKQLIIQPLKRFL